MPTSPTAAVVLFCVDLPRLTAFYTQVTGLQVAHADAQHTVLRQPGFELVLHVLRGEPTVATGPDGGVVVREDAYLKVCLPVADLAHARTRAAALGGGVLPADREWAAHDFIACDGHDPEGNVIQLRRPVA